MKDKIVRLGTIHQCNCCLGGKTLHPLVSVIDLSGANLIQQSLTFGFYTILLRECQCEDFLYGRQNNDYSNGTLTFLTPGQSIHPEKNKTYPQKGWILAFHPDLISGTSLGQNIMSYTFFSYSLHEALHISIREKQKVLECIQSIQQELLHPIDYHSKTLITKYIELLLDYCTRFYERQFITRSEVNKKLLTKLYRILDAYFETEQPQFPGLPTANYCADLLRLSTPYLEDLLKQETGKNTEEFVQFKRIEIAKMQLMNTHKKVGQIAKELGFPTPRIFNYLFKKITGYLPDEYRSQN